MNSNELNRRDFHRLSIAAMGGIMAGAAIGCKDDKSAAKTTDAGPAKDSDPMAGKGDAAVASTEKHLCRGLNTCKGLGGGTSAGKNACAGQGECATVPESSCHGNNECKGLGGCGGDDGEKAGVNECKGKGGCHIPLMKPAWKHVRARFEEKMKAAKKSFGDAPAKKSA